ncbi:MAG: DUF441 domain-containing protein [Firmicutes bacterium]|nr:DUF441 domain-containing protein [Bacillota bacterium]
MSFFRENLVLWLTLGIGLLGRSSVVTMAAGALLILRLLNLSGYLPALGAVGIDVGIFFLTIAVLAPLAMDPSGLSRILRMFTSLPGVAAVIGGALAAHLSGRGVHLLKLNPEITVGLIIGSIIGVLFLRGVPVGPLIAAGLASVLLQLVR